MLEIHQNGETERIGGTTHMSFTKMIHWNFFSLSLYYRANYIIVTTLCLRKVIDQQLTFLWVFAKTS